MKKIILISDKHTKRASYFQKAANMQHMDITIIPLHEVSIDKLKNAIVKIEPVTYNSANLSDLSLLVNSYMQGILKLELASNVSFLNTPTAICNALHKLRAKRILKANNIAITPFIDGNIMTIHDLYAVMKEHHWHRIFVKPVIGSGAMGVLACSFSRDYKKSIIETSLQMGKDKQLYNGRKLIRYKDQNTNNNLMQRVLEQGAIIEQWIPKSNYKKINYDLRVLVEFNEVFYITARGSHGAITNLDLNNQAIDFAELELSNETINSIKETAIQAVQSFDGMNVAGVDILLTLKNQKPYVIEVNAQGDHLHKDIYHNNSIYHRQIQKIPHF